MTIVLVFILARTASRTRKRQCNLKMAAPIKKRAVLNDKKDLLQRKEDSESSNEENSDADDIGGQPIQQLGPDVGGFIQAETDNFTVGTDLSDDTEHIQVDFEGRNPIDTDFHGIKQLLHQLFLKAHVNLSEITDLIIGQNYVGSVVKQSDMDMDDEGSDDESDMNDVFGITSVINLTEKQNLECVQQLRSLLVELCGEHATDATNTFVRSLLGDDSRPVGLLINERFINIPAQIAVPLLESLSKEMKRARDKKMAFEFSYFIIICKLYKVDNSSKKNKKKLNKKRQQQGDENEPEILWSNPEEELIDQEAECQFEFCVKAESDSGLSGQWLEDDVEMTPFRRVLLVSANKLDSIIERIKAYVAQ